MENLNLADLRTVRPRPVTENFQIAAWRSPASARFDSRPANDVGQPLETVEPAETDEPVRPFVMPRWFVAIAGGLIVAMLAVFAASALSL